MATRRRRRRTDNKPEETENAAAVTRMEAEAEAEKAAKVNVAVEIHDLTSLSLLFPTEDQGLLLKLMDHMHEFLSNGPKACSDALDAAVRSPVERVMESVISAAREKVRDPDADDTAIGMPSKSLILASLQVAYDLMSCSEVHLRTLRSTAFLPLLGPLLKATAGDWTIQAACLKLLDAVTVSAAGINASTEHKTLILLLAALKAISIAPPSSPDQSDSTEQTGDNAANGSSSSSSSSAPSSPHEQNPATDDSDGQDSAAAEESSEDSDQLAAFSSAATVISRAAKDAIAAPALSGWGAVEVLVGRLQVAMTTPLPILALLTGSLADLLLMEPDARQKLRGIGALPVLFDLVRAPPPPPMAVKPKNNPDSANESDAGEGQQEEEDGGILGGLKKLKVNVMGSSQPPPATPTSAGSRRSSRRSGPQAKSGQASTVPATISETETLTADNVLGNLVSISSHPSTIGVQTGAARAIAAGASLERNRVELARLGAVKLFARVLASPGLMAGAEESFSVALVRVMEVLVSSSAIARNELAETGLGGVLTLLKESSGGAQVAACDLMTALMPDFFLRNQVKLQDGFLILVNVFAGSAEEPVKAAALHALAVGAETDPTVAVELRRFGVLRLVLGVLKSSAESSESPRGPAGEGSVPAGESEPNSPASPSASLMLALPAMELLAALMTDVESRKRLMADGPSSIHVVDAWVVSPDGASQMAEDLSGKAILALTRLADNRVTALAMINGGDATKSIVEWTTEGQKPEMRRLCLDWIAAMARLDEAAAAAVVEAGAVQKLQVMQDWVASGNEEAALFETAIQDALDALCGSLPSVKLWMQGRLDAEDVAADGTFDVPPSCEFAALGALQSAVINSKGETVVLDQASDPVLASWVEEAKREVGEEPAGREALAKLAGLVADKMGGAMSAADYSAWPWQMEVARIRHELGSNVVPIGKLTRGAKRHRALLLKYLADNTGVGGVALARSQKVGWKGTGSMWNEAEEGDVVDVLEVPGRLLRGEPAQVYRTN